MLSAGDRAYQHLRDMILSGEFNGGQHLREERVAEHLGVSRTPVREALRRLSAEGLVLIDTHRGAQVASWTEQDIDEIYSIRTVLESYGARLAATAITETELEQLAELMEVMESKASSRNRKQVEETTQLNFEFHRCVLQMSGNRRLATAVSQIAEFPVLFRAYRFYSHDRLLESLAEHRMLVRALREQDADWAESIMREHVLAARAEQRRLFRELSLDDRVGQVVDDAD